GQVKEGSIKFIYSTNEDLITVRNFLKDNYGWNFEDTLETKELNLTHNLIANKAGFKTLMDIYDSDPIIKLKNDILRKIKDNKNKGVPDIIFDENDSFDSVVDKFMLKDRSKQLKKEVILSCPNNKHLYDSLKDKPFSEVRRIYLDKDSLIDDKKESEDEESKKGSKRDNLIKHLFKIQNIIQLYNDGMYNEFLRKTNYIINSIQDKRDLKQKIEELSNVQDKTIGEIIYDANTNNICLMDDNLEKFKREYEYIYNRVKDVKYEEFQHLYKYLEGSTPFSTQHKTKGREYNNVLVILDNGDWNDYNFNYLFNSENVLAELNAGKSKTKSKLASFPKILARTQKIFYVCCTRSKENLALFFHNPSQPIIDKAIDWFGSMNIINLD
ncbi:MAG: ATP-dependent helicase, partial [Prevotella sp.]|nr:ATP-dependent helicase [Prevotella sp.]